MLCPSCASSINLCDIDKRLAKRFDILLGKFIENPNDSIPKSLKTWKTIKSAYRFFHNSRITDDILIRESVKDTVKKLAGEPSSFLMIAHDTTHIDYSGLQVDGLGRNATIENTKGFLVHSSLALTEAGVPIGLLSQNIWTREEPVAERNKKQLPMEAKESVKWLNSFKESLSSLPPNVRGISVCDREADIYELLCAMSAEKHDFVIRSSHNRKLACGSLLENRIDGKSVLAEYEHEVQRVHEVHPKRTAKMRLRVCEAEIMRPEGRGKLECPETLRLNIVSAREETDGINKSDRISWTLLTTLPADSAESAMKVLDIYKHRWKIERFHYVLKSGCGIEKKQLKTVHSLKNTLAFLSIVAYKLLWLKYEAQACPGQCCEVVLSKTEWQALCCHSNKSSIPPVHPPSLSEAAVMIAKLGGFMARKNDGFPGVKAIWGGIRILHGIHETFLIFYKEKCG